MIMSSINIDLQLFHQRIQDLYCFRDEYFLLVPPDQYAKKQTVIDNKTKEILEQLNQISEKVEDKATYFFLKGWLLNIKDSYDAIVFESLTKSIKFNPEHEPAWLELGECYFKKGQLDLALNSFEKVINMNPKEKRALRNASIMLRSIRSTADKNRQNVLKSIDLAKKAVECDLEDKDSWAILGNAYLTLLFMTNGRRDQNVILNKCKSAYQKALLDAKVKTKSDVLFNYSSVLQYDEEFELALQCLSEAFLYDPTWSELKEKKERLKNFLNDIHNNNKIDKTVIKTKELINIKNYLKSEEKKLKTLYGNKKTFFNGETKLIEDLKEGFNDCLLICKIISYITDNHNIFFCSVYYSLDSGGNSITLLIYDIIKNKGPKPGDSIIIIRPFLKEYQIRFEDNEFRFKAIKIMDPLQEILVNNNPISVDCLAIPTVNVTLKSD